MWYNKEEVLEDLCRCTGGRGDRDLDSRYLVLGHNPPPPAPYMDDLDEEVALRFGRDVIRNEFDSKMQPDFHGIKEMLKMVREQNNDDCEVEVDLVRNAGPQIIISKLNPDCQEFIPKSINDAKLKNVDVAEHCAAETDGSKMDFAASTKSKDSDDVNKISENHINMAAEYKCKISEAAKCNSHQAKIQKNMAISSLLKLYTKDVKPIKLMTPDDFITKKEKQPSKNDHKESNSISNAVTDNELDSNGIQSIKVNGSAEGFIEDPQVKISISKVTNWLKSNNGVSKKRSICLGPVIFKHKEPNTPTSSTTEQTKVRREEERYKPSKYAEDLSKMYMERQKKKEEQIMKPTWDNIDLVLKQKDEEIKRKNQKSVADVRDNDEVESVEETK